MDLLDVRRHRPLWHSWYLTVVLAGVVLSVAGCASCDGSPTCPETSCGPGEVCRAGACVQSGECPGGCGQGEMCRNGRCVTEGSQCESNGEECDPNVGTAEGFLCVQWNGSSNDGRCAAVCSDGSSCREGAACVLTQSLADAPCASSSDCSADKTCSSGRCRYAVCRSSECEGFLEGDATCQEKFGDNTQQYPNGAKCYGVGNGANFCLPAGTRREGQTCTAFEQAVQQGDYTNTCATGFACASGTCVEACTANGDCAEQKTCVGVDNETIRPGVGQCAEACTPFAEDACAEGQTCRPIDSQTGRCVPAGNKAAFASCEPGAGQCGEGLACIAHQQGQPQLGVEAIARCHPMCDTSIEGTNGEGDLPEDAEQRRDATCPQPESAKASYRIVHVAAGAEPVDVYRSGLAQMPDVPGLAAGQASSHEGEKFATVDVGRYDFSVLPEGAPRTDLPLVEWTERFGAGEGRVFVLAAPEADADTELRAVSLAAPSGIPTGDGEVAVRVAHTMPGMDSVDVVALPPGQPPGSSANEILLADGLERDRAGQLRAVASGTFDVYVFEEGLPRESSEPLLTYEDVELTEFATLHLRGTYAAGDAYPTHPMPVVPGAASPDTSPDEPPMTCLEPQGRPFGYCQQICPDGASDYETGICDGESMGCKPVLNQSTQAWEHRCGPVGEAGLGESCDPFAEVSECAEGNYCLEYGNTRSGYRRGGKRGICHSLCRVEGSSQPGAGSLGCASGQACKPLSYTGGFGVGQCGVPCEPNEQFSDTKCPRGLKSCTPITSLQQDSTGGSGQPVVEQEQAFCAASGDVPAGQICRAQNCRPEAECMYPRSIQEGFVDALVSPYLGGSGQTPSCRLRCDPFDGDDANASCGSGETCLFNYPWNGEVGHCASIASNLSPGEACQNPGLSCGEDSICVRQEGENSCLRFCDYEGTNVQGELEQSTCPEGFRCHPFARDVGRCQRE